jgi:ketosteroid isomerase-like protein
MLVVGPALFAAPWFGAASQQPSSRSTATPAQLLLQLENGWTTALVKRDSAFFRRNLHPDYVYTDERGTFTKEQVIAEQIGGTDTVTSAENQNMHAHVHGSAAAVTGILIVRGRGAQGPFEHRYRYTDSFVREHGRWLMFASQDYEIPSR